MEQSYFHNDIERLRPKGGFVLGKSVVKGAL
jgi:hypothetical protein